ncbi:hypothetical protein L210DRAFT_802158, partial [Boletus edulis BED1]
IKIVNTRQASISVSISTTGEGGGEDMFFEAAPGGSGIWKRGNAQVAIVYLSDTGETRYMTVFPGSDYSI